MWVGKQATNQRMKFLDSLREGLKEQEAQGEDFRIEGWKEESKIITEREEYVEHMKAKIEDWNTEVDQLEEKSRNSGPDLRDKTNALIGELDQKLAEGQEKLRNIAGTTDDSWIDLKADAEVVWGSIQSNIDEIEKAFK